MREGYEGIAVSVAMLVLAMVFIAVAKFLF
jgi:hypothetical protein